MTMEAQKVAPALAAGNAVVLKPSELTPSPALELGRIALEAGLPPGVLNVLPGTGATAGRSAGRTPGREDGLVHRRHSQRQAHRRGGGRASSCRWRWSSAASRLTSYSPMPISTAAVDAVAGGIFEGSGQSCVAGSRLFVQRAVHDRVVETLLGRARDAARRPARCARRADGSDRFVRASRAHRARWSKRRAADGAEMLIGGAAPADAAPGERRVLSADRASRASTIALRSPSRRSSVRCCASCRSTTKRT